MTEIINPTSSSSPGSRAQGEAMWQRVLTTPAPPITDDFLAQTCDHVFGEVWGRAGLGTRERRLITLTCIALLGAQVPLENHLKAALASGDLTADELVEVAIHLAHYGGWPAGSVFYSALGAARA